MPTRTSRASPFRSTGCCLCITRRVSATLGQAGRGMEPHACASPKASSCSMSEGLRAAYETAKARAGEQWHSDLRAARERYDEALVRAEAEYEQARERQQP